MWLSFPADTGVPYCRGSAKDTRGTAYVVYEDIYDAKMAVDHLSGFNVANRYLIVLYFNPAKQNKKVRAWKLPLFAPLHLAGVASDKQHPWLRADFALAGERPGVLGEIGTE